MTNALAKLDKATTMLAEAKTLEEVKGILDIAEAARTYARAAKLGLEAYNHAAEVKVRAERKAGEMLIQLERGKGNQYTKVENSNLECSTSEYREVLDENKIPTTTAHRWQQLADMPEKEFEQHIEETRGEKPITTSGVLKDIKQDNAEKTRNQASKNADKLSLPELVSGLHLGDMHKVGKSIPNNSVDIVITDPPYPEEFIECWSWLSELAERVLKPSGFVFAYSGQLHLPEVYQRLKERLIYYWTLDLLHSGGNQLIMPRNVFCGWKPILIYQKPPFKRFDDKFEDTIKGSGREKGLHDWQQAESELDVIINTFTLPGQTILDPFCGSGTTLVAGIKNKRRVIGIEIDENSYLLAKKRISDAVHE